MSKTSQLPDDVSRWPDAAILALEERIGIIQEDPSLKGRATEIAKRIIGEEWIRKGGKL